MLDAGRFRLTGSLKELGIRNPGIREGTPENMSYSSSARKSEGASASANAGPSVAKAEVSIQFTSQGGFVFEAIGMQNMEFAERLALANEILKAYERGRWQKEWLLVDAVYRASSATIIVSEDSASEMVLKASGDTLLGSLPLADPKLGLSVASSKGKIVHVVAANDLRPLYSCLRVRDPLFGSPSVGSVRGLAKDAIKALSRPSLNELLES